MQGDRPQILTLRLVAHAPVIEDDKGDACICQCRTVVENGHARDRRHLLDARRGFGNAGDFCEGCDGSLQRSTVGQLHADHQIALVLVGNERAR